MSLLTISAFGTNRLVATFGGALVPLSASVGLSLTGSTINPHLN